MATVNRNDGTKQKSWVVYNLPGVRGGFYFPKSALIGAAPDSVEITGIEFVAPGDQKTTSAKMTPEERKAHMASLAAIRKNMTPAEKVEAKKKKLAKEQEALAKLEAAAAVA